MLVFGDINVHHKDWLTYSGGTDRPDELCYNFSITNYLTYIINFQLDSQSCLLDLFVSSDASIYSTMASPPLGSSDHIIISVSVDFPINSKQDTPFHCVGYDESLPDWDGLWDHLRDVPWDNIFKLNASTASDFYEWAQLGIAVYSRHRKYQVKPQTPWFSAAAAAAAAIVHKNHVF